jgi:Fe-S cluster assembly ATP-binding protein
VRQFIQAASGGKSERAVAESLSQVGLDPETYAVRAVDTTLSGGERKKVELASIVVMRPELVVLDEPDSGIDVSSLEQIFEAIRLLKDMGSTVLLVTHSLTVLEQAEHAFLMCSGTIIDKGDTNKVRPYFVNKCIPCDHKNIPDSME